MSSPEVVTLVICVLVALGTLSGLVGGLLRTVRILRALRPGLEMARSLASHPVPEAAFAHRWADLDAALRGSPIVAPAWTPFAASVERSTREDGSGAVASAAPPEDWLQSRHLTAGAWTDQAMGRLAGLLVSLGILGTFLGLTLGLVEADFGGIQALSSADARTAALQAAMFGLLAGSSTAFVTSVAGLTGSLLLTATVRLAAVRPVERALAELAASLRVGIRVEAPELRLARQLERIADQPDPGAELRPLLERLAVAMERLPTPAPLPHEDGRLEAVLEELGAVLRALPGPPAPAPEPAWATALTAHLSAPAPLLEPAPALVALLEAQQARLATIADAFTVQDRRLVALDARMRAVADAAAEPDTHTAAVVDQLEQLVQHLQATPTAPDALPELRAAAATAMSDSVRISLAPSLDALTQTARAFAGASERFDLATQRLDAAARSNHDAADTLRQASDALSTRLAVLQQTTAALRTGLAHHTDASTALTTAAATLQGVSPQLGRAADQVKLGAASMALTADRLSALQRASGGPELARLVPTLEALLVALEQRR